MPISARAASAAVTVVLVFLLLGCGGEAGAPGDGGKPRVALIMKSLANEFFVDMAKGAEEHQRAHADEYDLIVNGTKDESDIAQQVSLVEQMAAMNVDAIVIAPADSRALIPVLRKAQRQGIVVVNIDNKLDAETLQREGVEIPFVGPDNRKGAYMVGRALGEELEPGAEVVILEGIPTAFNAQERRRGFEDAMAEAGVRVVDVQSGYWEQSRGHSVAAAMVREHPNIQAILASNDNMALGAVAAVKQAGKSDQIQVVGFDNIGAIRDMVRNGVVLATADQHGDKLAVYGIEYALQILEGEAIPSDRETPVDLIVADSL